MRSTWAFIACACLAVVGMAQASSITYNFSGTVHEFEGASAPASAAITGWLTVDSSSDLLQDFSFNLPQLGGLDPWTGSSYVVTKANSYITINDALEYQIEAYNTVSPFYDETVLNLTFDSLPGGTHTGAGPQSSLQQAPLSGGNWTFLSSITGNAIGGAGSTVPEPPPITSLAGGLLLVGLCWRRKRTHCVV
ncbi:MAG: hypothetical protein ACREKE_01290 [bacterium]